MGHMTHDVLLRTHKNNTLKELMKAPPRLFLDFVILTLCVLYFDFLLLFLDFFPTIPWALARFHFDRSRFSRSRKGSELALHSKVFFSKMTSLRSSLAMATVLKRSHTQRVAIAGFALVPRMTVGKPFERFLPGISRHIVVVFIVSSNQQIQKLFLRTEEKFFLLGHNGTRHCVCRIWVIERCTLAGLLDARVSTSLTLVAGALSSAANFRSFAGDTCSCEKASLLEFRFVVIVGLL
mmetsp:Transcript_5306/g.10556  ORF Transcript_5306/g.10556 Transcript_5306/m.10556 type:complete len:237 (-) Transcript_5306:737-1447(-)